MLVAPGWSARCADCWDDCEWMVGAAAAAAAGGSRRFLACEVWTAGRPSDAAAAWMADAEGGAAMNCS